MIDSAALLTPETSALVLLAAGRSERFGVSDKLAEPFLGRPLAMHIVVAMEGVPFAHRFVVVGPNNSVDFAACGYTVIANPKPDRGVSSSVCMGTAAARKAGVTSVVIALADMPRVTAAQIWRLFESSHGPDSIVASSDGKQPRPPALFGSALFETLEGLRGDEGARPLILKGRHVVTAPAELVDVDTEQDVEELRQLYGHPRDG